MCNEHEETSIQHYETGQETNAVERGQGTPSPDYEKGARDQEFRTISEVGHENDDRKGEARENILWLPRHHSGWFSDETFEIGLRDPEDEDQAIFPFAGGVANRTKTSEAS